MPPPSEARNSFPTCKDAEMKTDILIQTTKLILRSATFRWSARADPNPPSKAFFMPHPTPAPLNAILIISVRPFLRASARALPPPPRLPLLGPHPGRLLEHGIEGIK
mmetsp:Transcript_57577/g.122152  ORF Transcript_57577/g.122152 Transcript_57577/m.122152 type:complete len:107 (+) Transcript_57577:93-413(+)